MLEDVPVTREWGGQNKMKVFLTSSLNNYVEIDGKKVVKPIDNVNGLVDQLIDKLDDKKGITFIPSDFANKEAIKEYSNIVFESLRLSGIVFDNYYILTNNEDEIEEMISSSSMVFIAGGDTYKQNCAFQNISLKNYLEQFSGVIMGQSAGAINLAQDAYNSPECEEDLPIPSHFKGLGITNVNVEPHFVFDSNNFDENEIFQRNEVLKESIHRDIYAICDTSHIFDDGDNQTLYGEGYLISNGNIVKLCEHVEKYEFNT